MILSTSRKRCRQAKSYLYFQEDGQKRKMVIKIEFTTCTLSQTAKCFPNFIKKGWKKMEKNACQCLRRTCVHWQNKFVENEQTRYRNTPIFGTVSGMLPKSKTVHRLGICSTSLKTYNSIKKDSFFIVFAFCVRRCTR